MTLGVLMLDTRFARFPGDIGAPDSFAGPVIFEHVPHATPSAIVGLNDDAFLEPFIAAGHRLVTRGARAVTTSCGYLVAYQAALAARLPVPVATSALLMIALLERLLRPQARIGVLTFCASSLSPAHLSAAGATREIAVEGLPPGGAFQRAIFGEPHGDGFAQREADAVSAANALVARTPGLSAIVLECTNLSPHRAAIETAANCPVYDLWPLVSLITQGRTRDARA